MASQINVRLSPEDERLAAELQAKGVVLSDVIRRALREEAARLGPTKVDARAMVTEMLARFPAPEDATAPEYPDPHDRHAVAAFIANQLRNKR